MNTKINKITLILLALLFVFPCIGSAQLTINLVAVNASDEAKAVPVKHYLPKELEPEDVLESGELKVEYDVDSGSYYVQGNVQFKPKETKTFKIKVKDVWVVDPEEVEILKNQLNENLDLMEGGEHHQSATALKDDMVRQLDYILSQQTSYSQNIERRIEEYRAYIHQIEEIRSQSFSLEAMTTAAKGREGVADDKTIKFLIEVKNPSDKDEKTVTQKHLLPKEIRAEHVIEKQGFDVRFDNKKQKAYLSKEETFKPGEVKKYEIVIKDVWQFPLSKTDALETRAKKALEEILGSVFEKTGQYLFDTIADKLTKIRNTQVDGLPIKEHIGNHRLNTIRFEEAERDVVRLEQILAIVRAKKLEDLEEGKVKNVLQRMRALRGLSQLSEALFKKGISVTQTWRIIFGTIIFIAVFTTWHFITWRKRSKTMGEEIGLKPGEKATVVPKPGEEEAQEEEEEAKAA